MTRKYNQYNEYRVVFRTDEGAFEGKIIRARTSKDARSEARDLGIRRIKSVTYYPPITFSSTPEFDAWADPDCPRMEY